ncbi:MAG: hypothetical protein G8345_13785, partial [Magnetococcales bacterium]|nr:hypothetical protein [Magnetococcales bacterium]
LVGSGVGAVGALFLMDGRHPLEVLDLLGVATAILALFPAYMAGSRYFMVGLVSVVLVFFMGQYDPARLPLSQYKDLARTLLMPDTKVMAEGFDPRGVLTVVQSPYLRSAAGLSLTYAGLIPPRPVVFFNGSGMDTFPQTDKPEESDYLNHTLYALPYPLRNPRSVLVPHSGAGGEILLAGMKGAKRIVALEPNRTLVRLATAGLPGYPTVYNAPGVEIFNQDARAYLEQSGERFDLIAMPTVSGQTAVSSAMRSIYEDYLMTVDAFSAMFDRLNDNGIIRCSVSLDAPPRRPLRLFAILAETLRQRGVTFPEKHLLVVRSWNLTLFMLSKHPFQEDELKEAAKWAADEGFDPVFPTDLQEGPAQHQTAEGGFGENLAAIAAGEPVESPFNLSPPTDNHPYFEHFLTRESMELLRERYGPAGLLLLEWGYVMVWMTLIALFMGGVGLIILPLWFRYRSLSLRGDSSPLLIYFAGIGAGFMLVEMVLIQKLTLLLGDPVYAVGAVLAALLVFAGFGSMTSERWTVPPARLASVTGLVLGGLVLLFWLAFPRFYDLVAPFSLTGRLFAVILALAPIAWLMGWFFPNGIRAILLVGKPEMMPWAWAVNGMFSVLSGTLGVVLALNSGLTAVAFTGLACYAVAVFAMMKANPGHS